MPRSKKVYTKGHKYKVIRPNGTYLVLVRYNNNLVNNETETF